MNKPRILTVGSANVDLVAKVPTIPTKGQTIKADDDYEYMPGGKGANSALAVARVGGESIFCAKLGSDTHGARLSSLYQDENINTRFVTVKKNERTGLAVVLSEPNGDNRIITYAGANNYLKPIDTEEALSCYPDALLMQFEIPAETILCTAKEAHYASIPIIIDAGPAIKDFPFGSLPPVEIFSPNESEAYAYTGIMPSTIDNCLKTCMALQKMVTAKYYVLKLGERGIYLYDGKYFKVIAPYNVKVKDTTGAGDIFTAAMTVEYLRSYNIHRACEYGNIAAAISITKKGAFTSCPTEEEINEFITKNDIVLK